MDKFICEECGADISEDEGICDDYAEAMEIDDEEE